MKAHIENFDNSWLNISFDLENCGHSVRMIKLNWSIKALSLNKVELRSLWRCFINEMNLLACQHVQFSLDRVSVLLLNYELFSFVSIHHFCKVFRYPDPELIWRLHIVVELKLDATVFIKEVEHGDLVDNVPLHCDHALKTSVWLRLKG